MNPFKIGDKVKLVHVGVIPNKEFSHPVSQGFLKNSTYTVSSISNEFIRVEEHKSWVPYACRFVLANAPKKNFPKEKL